jgi:uncharacterized membrane protein
VRLKPPALEGVELAEEIRAALAPYYLYIKAVHVMAAALWAFSTAVAWVFYLKPALRRAARAPEDAEARDRRDHYLELFDRGAGIEHVALIVLVATALLMIWLARVDLARWSFVTAKLWLGVLVILPMEAADIYLSHLGGNKERIRRSGDMARYRRMVRHHTTFLRITEPIVVVLVPLLFVLAVAKPF